MASIFLQEFLYSIIKNSSPYSYGAATALTYLPLILINFLVQQGLIFHRPGRFTRFIIVNLLVMLFVSFLSVVLNKYINGYSSHLFKINSGFLLAALIGSVPSFLLSKKLVYV